MAKLEHEENLKNLKTTPDKAEHGGYSGDMGRNDSSEMDLDISGDSDSDINTVEERDR